jgi:hypothetical protein
MSMIWRPEAVVMRFPVWAWAGSYEAATIAIAAKAMAISPARNIGVLLNNCGALYVNISIENADAN